MRDTESRYAGVEAGVGLTALLVAAARAIETHRADSLAQDAYAEHFVRAARATANWPLRPHEVPDGEANPLWGRLARYFGLRTRVLDDFLLRSVREGVRQAVILGAGLDSRAFRLDWPPGCALFEIDRAEVLAFKDNVLRDLNATPGPARTPVAADLRTDWAGALADAGHDPAAPTAWLAEGLLLYLPGAAERHLIATVDRLSPRGSTLAYEAKVGTESREVRESPIYTATKDQTGVDLLHLFDSEPRPDSAGTLTARGWSTSTRTPFDFTHQYGRGPLPEAHDALSSNRWVFATRTTR
ncbi:putative S-adenosyl-L-methionine-dependent methyltransferase [Streptomyces sulfonofaciens]|uniref:S-adenosyl-L-methionine-dependent methyltransferase n=1 Tax=Streptomyces sulfonofaciens TaxID=68272 RepID=A0A919FPP8_9ACTN|nr:class I SAM-dependent methyltransferase [Streptomyces sulfonofaciens]GHH69691.1 putative S-adenosyl-L-methionine-dependent methyltransferase [Streptomyces sulfonofaciens]